VANNGGPLALLTIRRETSLFIDQVGLQRWRSIMEGRDQLTEDWFEATAHLQQLLSLRQGDGVISSALGLESDWKFVPESAADQAIELFYARDTSFRAHFEGTANGGAVVIGVGKASASIPIGPSEAESAYRDVEALRDSCRQAEASGQDPRDWGRALESTIGVGTTSAGIHSATKACAAALARTPGGGWGKITGCIVAFLGALLGFRQMVKDAQSEQQLEQMMRDRERACEERGDFAGVDMDKVDRAGHQA
jgi:hypothetical protein